MKKFKSIFMLVALTVLTFSCLCACSPNDEQSSTVSNSSPTVVETELSLNANELALTVGEEVILQVNYNPVDGYKKSFTSSNDSVASIDEYGRITANSVGETTITVKYGEDEATCKVMVGYGDMLPVLKFEESFGDSLQIGFGEDFNLKAYVSFNEKKYDDAIISYSVTEADVGSVTNGIFTPNALGTTSVTVSATWRGLSNVATMTKTFEITVLNDVEIVINDGKTDFTLYNLSEIGGNSYQTGIDFVVSANENNSPISSENILIDVISGNDVVSYDNGEIHALKPGVATICVTVTDQTGAETQELVDIVVKTSVGKYDKELLFSAHDGELPIETIFGKKVDLVSAEMPDGTTLEINADKNGVLGLKTTNNEGPSLQKITVYSDTQGWELSLKVYSAVINEASDLDMFHFDGKAFNASFTETDTFSGYYILANDIDMADSIFNTSPTITDPNSIVPHASMLNVGLTGMFDGNGYRIYNLNRYNGSVGLFAAINGGTVKNVSISSSADYMVQGATPYLAGIMRNATFDNVHIKVAKRNGSDTSLLARAVINSTFKNCIFEGVSNQQSHGLFTFLEAYGQQTEIATTFKNCYFISSSSITHRSTYNNVWYEAKNVQSTLTETEKASEQWKDATWLDGIKRYATAMDMISDVANNDYSGFNEAYWDKSSGMPVWKIVEEEVVGAITYEKTLTFSAKDGLFFDDDGNVVSIDTIFGTGTATLAKHSTDTLTVENGKVLGLKTNGSSVLATTIVLKGDAKTVKVNVNAYTLVINEASDLDMFHQGGKASTAANSTFDTFDGYYILAKDIDMTGSIFNTSATITGPNDIVPQASMKNVGLTGTFDGNGYRIYNFDRYDGSVGLFAAINGGTVKNVSISSSADYLVQGATPYLAGIMRNATFDNVHIKVSKRNGSDTNLLARAVVASTFKNCIFEGLGNRDTSHGLFTFLEGYGQQTDIKTTFENCYYISTEAITHRVNQTQVWYDASNMKDLKASDTVWASATWLEGIKRYETAAAMIADASNNNYNNFNANYWDTTSGMPVWKVKA